MRRIILLLGLGLLALAPAGVATSASAGPIASAPPRALELTYRAYAAGFRSLDFSVNLDLGPSGYRITLAYRTVGLAGFLFPGHSSVTAEGFWAGDTAEPRRFESRARWSGRHYDVLMDFPEGAPVVSRLVPSEAKRREAVPAAERIGTIDTASAIALLLKRVIDQNGCRLAVRVFDGRRLMVLSAHPAGSADLGVTGRSFFHGPAERCDVAGKMLAGFLDSDGKAARERVSHGVVWFAHPVAGYPLLPVRIAFSARWFGSSMMYLTNIKTVPAAPLAGRRHVATDPPRAAASPPVVPAGR